MTLLKMYKNYEKTRFTFNKSRRIVWEEIARYLKKYISSAAAIIELGSGYCDFINTINASKKYALDKYLDPRKYAEKNVTCLNGDSKIFNKTIKDSSLDVVFASNFLEHLNQEETEKYLDIAMKKLKMGGLIILIQPNYKFCAEDYFDDHTHIKAWSHVGLVNYLKSKGLKIVRCVPRFMPFSMKSKLPKNRYLIRAYLNSPIKPFAKQMLIIAKKI